MPNHNTFFLSLGAICGSIIIAGGMISAALIFSDRSGVSQKSDQQNQAEQNKQQNKEVSFELADTDPRLGSEDAPVTIVEFSDYGCPFCKRYHSRTLSKIKNQFISDEKVNYVYKHNPITRLHPEARKQAILAQCVAKNAGDQAFFDLTGKIFANQDAAKKQAKMYDLASEVGVEKSSISSCVDNKETDSKIAADKDVAKQIGARGTPTFVIGTVKDGKMTGKLLVGAQPFSKFESRINSLLN